MNEARFHLGIKALIRNKKGQILILEKNPKGRSGLNPPHWDLPGGRLKNGDDIEKTLKREVEEEIGIRNIKIIEFFDASLSKFRVYDDKEIVGLIFFTFLCSIKNPEDVKLTDVEHSNFKWADKKEAARRLLPKFSKELAKKILGL